MWLTTFQSKESPDHTSAKQGTEGHRSAVQKASPAKIVPAIIAGAARFGLGRAITSGAARTLPTLLPKAPSILSKAKNFVGGMFSLPATIASTGAYLYGDSQGKKSEKARLENIGKNTGTTTPKTETKTKTKTKTSTGDPYAKAKKKDPNLDSYIAGRKKHAKGSAEYNAFQNKINAAYGVSKRHGTVSASASASASASSGQTRDSQNKQKKKESGEQKKGTRRKGTGKNERKKR